MKKKVLFGVLLASTLILTGCGAKEEIKTLSCTRKATIMEGVDADLSYKVTYKGDYVQLVESREEVISENEAYLENYKTAIENVYSPYNDVEYYEYNVELKNGSLVSTTKINYEKIDTDKMIDIDSANATLIKDGKIKISDIKSIYENLGMICE